MFADATSKGAVTGGWRSYWPSVMAAGASLRGQWTSRTECGTEKCARNRHDFPAAKCYRSD
jgi:hypothetical protein